jgi:23S rRNA pseudouridine1911/1915/1917 synthase
MNENLVLENNVDIVSYTVELENEGTRLDVFLSEKLDKTRSFIQNLIDSEKVFVNGKVKKKNYKLSIGESVSALVPPPQNVEIFPENIPLNIVYEDDDLIVVNKPAGMTVHPAAGVNKDTLVNALLFHCKGSLSGIGGVARPGIVHRIDRNTSGVLVIAKNDITHRGLAEQFFNHSIERTYYAIVYGVPSPVKGTIEGNIARSSFDRKKMAIVKIGGKSAITHYELIENYKNAISLIKCNLETGRTHQIRVHLSSIGCHLVGDDVYEKPKKSNVLLPNDVKKYVNSFPRQALHAYSLGFIHPRTKEFLSFCADFPSDLKELVETLKK